MRWLWIRWCGINFYRFWTMSLSLCLGELRVLKHPLLSYSLFHFSLCVISTSLHIRSFILSLHARMWVFVCSVCLWRGCVCAEAYHNKQSKSPVGIRTFSPPPVCLWHLWIWAHSTAHIQITQPAKASWMTSALLSITRTQTHTHMYARTHTHTKPFSPQTPREIRENIAIPYC